ncbi:hypothetical protein F5B18DRAFT_130419 [Nemania serpens]|nr:hypothetical protein F5B18DRAFT_130419 [Nemania serpens]
MEVFSTVAAGTAIADQLLKACLTGYQLFTAAQSVGKDFEKYLYRLEVSHHMLEDWISEVQSDERKLQDFIDTKSHRYRLVLQTLAKIAGTFADVEQLKKEYGIVPIDELADTENAQVKLTVDTLHPASAVPATFPKREHFFYNKLSAFKSRLRSKSPAPPARTSTEEAHFGSTQTLVPHVPTTDDVPGPNKSEEKDLDRIVPNLEEWVVDVKNKAARYQQIIPTLGRYKWAYKGNKESLRLVEDLEAYVRYLEGLTKYPLERLKSAPMLTFPAPFNEFKVQWQLPYPRLDNFCGREDILEEMENFFIAPKAEKSSARRRAVVLQGMGGLGKSQIALEYNYRHPRAYTAVFWVDATDQSTIHESGRHILQTLIVHYSTKHHGKTNFADVATDLGIPGQIKSDGTLADELAKATWLPIKRWLARDSNLYWCLVVDGLNLHEDEDRMRELLPASDNGHIIVTSRVPIANFKLIDIPEMDELSCLKLLLRDIFETASDETIHISQSIPKYPRGLVSCWELSIQALIKSNMTHSVDLLRLCSFLSPEGVSKELLVRGLTAMEWFTDDESQLEDAIDNLVMYALLKRKSSTAPEEGETYWIHPLVRHWAQDAAYDGESVVLETDSTRLQKLHNKGYLQAIALVGCSLNTRGKHREECEWSFERRNMTHISLCLDTYIPEYDFGADEAAATHKVALALASFAGFNVYWNDIDACATNAELSVNLYRKLMPAESPQNLEVEMLRATQ